MENLTQTSCAGFAEVLASKAPVPGGGGAAALAGALGTALCSMVGHFTVGKKKYAAVEADIQAMLDKAEGLRRRLLELVDEDARAFAPLSRAYAIPKEASDREGVLEAATLGACKAPVEMVHRCGEALDLLAEMGEKGSRMLISDVGCGALLCRAAMESAAMNVYINTKSLLNREEAGRLEAEIDDLLRVYLPRADAIAAAVTREIRGEAQ